MKKVLLTIGMVLLGMGASACPKPNGHCIVEAGCSYGYSFADKVNSKDNLGFVAKVGYEIPLRFLSVCGVGGTAYTRNDWFAGGEVNVAPLGISYGYDSPINPIIVIGGGYGNMRKGYGSVGLELTGRMGYIVMPYARCTFDMYNLGGDGGMKMGVTASVGIRCWLGKSW